MPTPMTGRYAAAYRKCLEKGFHKPNIFYKIRHIAQELGCSREEAAEYIAANLEPRVYGKVKAALDELEKCGYNRNSVRTRLFYMRQDMPLKKAKEKLRKAEVKRRDNPTDKQVYCRTCAQQSVLERARQDMSSNERRGIYHRAYAAAAYAWLKKSAPEQPCRAEGDV